MISAPESVVPNLSDPATYEKGMPYEAFRALRERPGLYWQPTDWGTANGGFWAVARFEDIVAIEKNTQTFTSTMGAAYPAMTMAPVEGPMGDLLIQTDPPRHSALRRAVAAGFGPRIVANFDPWIREIVQEVIASVEDLENFDWVDKFARTIPAYVIARIMGAPAADRQRIVGWITGIFTATQQRSDSADQSSIMQSMLGIFGYAAEIQALKRRHPADDMCTVLDALVQRGELTQQEFEIWMVQLMGAGFETTHTAIGHAMRMYLEDPQVREATDRGLLEGDGPSVVDEYIRLISPIVQMARTATQDAEVAGTQIRKGDVVVMFYPSANRDQAVFQHADDFDPWRTETDSLSFGAGPHRCVGMYVAQLEVRILFEELRASGMKLRLDGVPKRGYSNQVNQLLELPVARVR